MIQKLKKTSFGKRVLDKADGSIYAEVEQIDGWERALREWQQDLKQYRKNVGNFLCALDKYENFQEKVWQYREEDVDRLQQAYREHLLDTAEKLRMAEEQIRAHFIPWDHPVV